MRASIGGSFAALFGGRVASPHCFPRSADNPRTFPMPAGKDDHFEWDLDLPVGAFSRSRAARAGAAPLRAWPPMRLRKTSQYAASQALPSARFWEAGIGNVRGLSALLGKQCGEATRPPNSAAKLPPMLPAGKDDHFEWDLDLPGFGYRRRKSGMDRRGETSRCPCDRGTSSTCRPDRVTGSNAIGATSSAAGQQLVRNVERI